jgi:hypothetical protein
MICIYFIENIKNKKVYIGSTLNYDKRKSEHIKSIKNKNHHNQKINSDLNTFDINDFIFYPVSTFNYIDRDILYRIEYTWIDYLYTHIELYNMKFNTMGKWNFMPPFKSKIQKREFRLLKKIEVNKIRDYFRI